MVAMETKKMVFLCVPCQQLLREKSRLYNVYKYSLWVSAQSNQYFFRKMLQPVPLFHVTRALDPSNKFGTTKKWVKILLFPKFKMFVIEKTLLTHLFSPFYSMGHFSYEGPP